MSIGNISKDIRRRPSERAMLLIGYLPVASLSHISNPEERRERRWQLFHTCMESILEPLKELSLEGEEMLCADGGVRRIHPILAAYIADYPEQCTVTCVRESRCPICWVPTDERGDLTKQYGSRGRHQTMDALEDYWEGHLTTIKTLGIRPGKPFWANLPYVDISCCITPDMLHQLNKGVFGEHVVDWCTAILGEAEVDRRTMSMPRFQKLRHFSRGVFVLHQWTGSEAKALASTFLAVMAGCDKAEAVTAAWSIIDFMYRAHLPELSADDLDAMDRDLAGFHDVKHVFVDPENDHLPSSEGRFNNIPKLHMISHYTRTIRELGSPDGYNSENTERLHIDYVKEAWRASNHVNATQQMAVYLQRQEAWALLRAHLHDSGQLLDERFRHTRNDTSDGEEVDEAYGDLNMDEGDGEREDEDDHVWYPTPSITIAKRPGLGRRAGTYLINEHKTTDLIPATLRFLRNDWSVPEGTVLPLSHQSVFNVWKRCKLHHKRLPFLPSFAPQVDQVRAFPCSVDDEGRTMRFGSFDVILFSPIGAADANTQGLHRSYYPYNFILAPADPTQTIGFQAGRVRAIFELPRSLLSLCSEKLVYIEHFRPFSAGAPLPLSLHSTSHMMQGNRRFASVIPLSRLRLACHLAPRYQLLDPNYPVSSTSDLLADHNRFYLNKYASHFLFIILEYWRKRRQGTN
ncbi:hypothetical protein FRC10_004158, partial [Ceratobasidium sp. 414]